MRFGHRFTFSSVKRCFCKKLLLFHLIEFSFYCRGMCNVEVFKKDEAFPVATTNINFSMDLSNLNSAQVCIPSTQ